MSKTQKRDPIAERDPLADAKAAFVAGDYVTARQRFDLLKTDETLAEAERATAAEYAGATRVDRVTLWVGLACVVLAVVAVTLTALVQP